ncbi:MAG: hypothetical protein WCO93_13360 [bacterium]
MKSGLLNAVALSSVFLFLFSSCLKNDEEPVPVYTMNDYVGQWKGTFPMNAVDDPFASELKMSLIPYANNTILTGYLKSTDGILILDNAIFFGGVYSFTVRNNSFYDPNCQSWNASGSAYLLHINNIGISYGGTFCGTKPIDITGTMTRASLQPDSSVFLTMAAAGHRLVYDVTMFSGINEEATMEYQKDLGTGVWRMKATLNGWPNVAYLFVTPVEWGTLPMNDSLAEKKITAYRIDAKTGVKYITVTPGDSIISTVTSLGEMVTVPAGTFRCIKVTQEFKPLVTGGMDETREFWISNYFGMVMMNRYLNDSLVTTQVLKEKNF